MSDETDAEIIRTSLRSPGAFEAVFERHFDAVRIYSQRRVGPIEGEEIAGATFEVAFANRDRFDSRRFTSARPWLLGIANNLIRADLRKRGIRTRAYPLATSLDVDPIDALVDRLTAAAQRAAVREALMSLSLSDRETFLFVVLGELTYPEAGALMGVPTGTVRSRMNRARRLLHELIGGPKAINLGIDHRSGDQDE